MTGTPIPLGPPGAEPLVTLTVGEPAFSFTPAQVPLSAALALVIVAYLLGAIPFGYLIGRWRGLDIRASGSGNIGATNAARVLGRKWGIVVLLCDALKGWGPVALGLHVMKLPAALVGLVGLAAFIGHVFPLWLDFKGGKGVATAAGVLLAVAPLAALAGFVVYAACYFIWRISSVGSLAGLAVALPMMLIFYRVPAYGVLMGTMAALVIWTHRGNIQRLMQKKESKV